MQIGFTLDIARKYYSPDDLISLISMLSKHNYTFLHLHISDDENYGIESTLLNQTTKNAVYVDGTYICKTTGNKFLSIGQLNRVVSYARDAGIEIIPEIDSPAHMGGIWKLLEGMITQDSKATNLNNFWTQLRVATSNELNMSDPLAAHLMTALYSEVINIFGGTEKVKYFHIGGDEFGGAETPEYEGFIPYVNHLILWLNHRGIVARLWNDGITRFNISKLNGDFEVTYWTSGKHGRCTMKDLIDFGISVFNYNRYYLYFLPGKNGTEMNILNSDIAKAASDIEKIWDPGLWDANCIETRIKVGNKILGASVAIWGEYAGNLDAKDIILCSEQLVNALEIRVKNEINS